jgi:SAM-dependent methyltransferase
VVLAESGSPRRGGASNDQWGTRDAGPSAPEGARGAAAENHWHSYWAAASWPRETVRAEAQDYVERLTAAVAIEPSDHVLDFGCGFGEAARLLAARVDRIALWDQSASILDAARRRLGGHGNVYVVDLSTKAGRRSAGPFSLILTHSVVQYMTELEFRNWLARWRSMLAPGGRIIVSDVPVPGSSALFETAGLIGFAVRQGILGGVMAEGVRALASYVRTRKRAPLLHLGASDIASFGAVAGLTAEVLPRNLGHRRRRLSVRFTAWPVAGPSR